MTLTVEERLARLERIVSNAVTGIQDRDADHRPKCADCARLLRRVDEEGHARDCWVAELDGLREDLR